MSKLLYGSGLANSRRARIPPIKPKCSTLKYCCCCLVLASGNKVYIVRLCM